MIGLIITINEYKNYFKSYDKTFICDTIDIAKNELIKYIAELFNKLDIDFPEDIYDFERIWYDNKYINAKIYNYKLFIDNKWIEPWEYEELYYDIIDQIVKIESEKPVEEEINDDNDDDNNDNNSDNENKNEYEYLESSNNDKLKDFEDNIEKILSNLKNI